MNGVHDMGGMHGFGAVQPEPGEPPFHAPWEKRALGLTLAMGATGQWNIDMSRSARESLDPATYLASSYYRIWILGLERLLIERGLVTAGELAAGHAIEPPKPVARVLRAGDVDAALARGSPTLREAAPAPPAFGIGQRVRARNMHPSGHTRLPRYVRGHAGRVTRLHGAHVFADRHAVRQPDASAFDEAPIWLYTVEFDGAELWGADAEPGVRVSVDAWEPYLEVAE
jgi:nitrile hydratase